MHRYTAVFTIHAASCETIKESYGRIGELAGLEPTESAGKHFLSQQREPWLLIIDNADDHTLQLRRLFPPGGTAHILVTTRVRDFRCEGTLGSLELKGLEEWEALQLLLTKADIRRPWDTSTTKAGSRIAKALGYLALALIQAGTCVYRGVCGLGGYLEIHTSARNKLQSKASPGRRDCLNNVVEVVYSAFDVSLGVLQKQMTEDTQDALDLLKIIAFYHFEFIPLEIFSRAVVNREKFLERVPAPSWAMAVQNALLRRLEPPKPLPAFLKGEDGKLDRYRINHAIAALQSLSFIRSDGKYISLHPLIHAWARDSLAIPQRHIWASIALTILMEAVSLPPEGSPQKDGSFHRDILPHLDACLAETGDPVSSSTRAMATTRFRIAKFCQPTMLLVIRSQVLMHAKLGYVYAERGQFKEAATHLHTVREMLVKVLGDEDDKTMKATLALAGVCWGLGRLEEAITLQRSVVGIRSRIFGPNDEQTLEAMDALGRSYWLHGQYQEALELQEVTTSRIKVTLGPKHPRTLAALDNLGVTLGAWHRYRESLEMHQEVLEARVELLGEVHQDTLATKANLAMALLDLGQHQDAKAIMTEVFRQRQKQLGKEHPWTLWALCYLAKIDIAMGLVHQAEAMLN